MHELPSTHQEGVKERATKEEIYQELHNGYNYLQNWWRELVTTLSHPIPLQEIAKINWSGEDRVLFKGGRPLVSYTLQASFGIIEYLTPPFGSRLQEDMLYEFRVFVDSTGRGRLQAESLSKGQFHKRYTPSYTPFYSLALSFSDFMRILDAVEIRHNSKDKRGVLKTTHIYLAHERQIIDSIVQTAKEETFFPRPDPPRTKTKPTQVFSLSIDNNDNPAYKFQYANRRPDRTLTDKKISSMARRAAQRRSFLPHGIKFDLVNAIQRAYFFSPVVLPPETDYVQAILWNIFNKGVFRKIPELDFDNLHLPIENNGTRNT